MSSVELSSVGGARDGDAEFGGLPRVVGGAARDQNQGTAVITNQLLGTLDMSRPLNVAL